MNTAKQSSLVVATFALMASPVFADGPLPNANDEIERRSITSETECGGFQKMYEKHGSPTLAGHSLIKNNSGIYSVHKNENGTVSIIFTSESGTACILAQDVKLIPLKTTTEEPVTFRVK